MWGALCQRKHSYTFIGEGTKYTSDLFEVPTGHMIKTIIPLDKDKWMVKYHTPEDIFQGEYPRVAPFLLALGRKTISEIIEPYADQLNKYIPIDLFWKIRGNPYTYLFSQMRPQL